jgi:hypothetical protein
MDEMIWFRLFTVGDERQRLVQHVKPCGEACGGRPSLDDSFSMFLSLKKVRTGPRSERGELVRILPVLYVIFTQAGRIWRRRDAGNVDQNASPTWKLVENKGPNRFSRESSLRLYVPVVQLFTSDTPGVTRSGTPHTELNSRSALSNSLPRVLNQSPQKSRQLSANPATTVLSGLNFACHQPVIQAFGGLCLKGIRSLQPTTNRSVEKAGETE